MEEKMNASIANENENSNAVKANLKGFVRTTPISSLSL